MAVIGIRNEAPAGTERKAAPMGVRAGIVPGARKKSR
jgi:hypothetical protein